MQAKIVMVQEFPDEGILRLRVDTFRELGEPGYEEHYVPDVPPEGYPGEKDAEGIPLDPVAYQAWLDSLPKKTNPCLCQFILVPLGTHPLKIQEIVKAHTQRVKAAPPIDVRTDAGLEALKLIERGLDNHLTLLGINRMKVKCRDPIVFDGEGKKIFPSLRPDHKLLRVRVTE